MWQALGVDPKMLADSAKSTAEKERLAASRVDAYLDRMMAGQAQPLSLPTPLKKMLDAKYESSVNSAGIDRAVERATKVRAVGGLGTRGEPAQVADSASGRGRSAGRRPASSQPSNRQPPAPKPATPKKP